MTKAAEQMARWRAKNRAHVLAYVRQRRARLKELIRQQDREHYARTKAKHAANHKKWILANKDRVALMDRAKNAVHRAIKKGVLTRPAQCSRCQATAPIEAAHHDYTKPLDVVWLCRPCHRTWDSQKPKTI